MLWYNKESMNSKFYDFSVKYTTYFFNGQLKLITDVSLSPFGLFSYFENH